MRKKVLISIVIVFSFFQGSFALANTNTNTTTNISSQNNPPLPGTPFDPNDAGQQQQTTLPTPATIPAAATSSPTSGLSAPAIPVLLQQIKDAKRMLAGIDLSYNLVANYKISKSKKTKTAKAKQTISSYSLGSKDTALAILEPSQKITIIKGTLSGQNFSFNAPGFEIRQKSFNGVNTRFQVNRPEGGIVLAMKYMLSGPESGSKETITNSLSQVIYVPYSPELNTYALAQSGQAYLDKVLTEVVQELNNIRSASMPGHKLTEAIKPAIIKALIYDEHMGSAEFFGNPDTQSLINRINVLYAVNEGDTFKYSVSSGNARGIAQFIPSTYLSLVKRHPEANLNPNAIAGLEDHVNAIKAIYLLIDDYVAAVHVKVADNFNPAFIYDYGAASYNGGVGRVTKAVQTYGSKWDSDHTTQTNDIQAAIGAESATIKDLKAQIKSAKAKDKSQLKAQLGSENAKLDNLNSQLSLLKKASLSNQTILYLYKMRTLIAIFNSQQVAGL